MQSPRSPTRTKRHTVHNDVPSFMRRPPKPEGVKTLRTINNLTPAELEERYEHNARTLAETSTSSSTFIRQLEDQQAAIKKRLNDLGVERIRTQLEHTNLHEADVEMSVDQAPPPPPPQEEPRPIGAKQRALARWNPAANGGNASQAAGMSYDEATRILQESYKREQEHKARLEDKRRRRGDVGPHEQLTRAEMDARMLAFLTYKPSGSDVEDDDEDEDEDDDENGRPSWWDEDDQDDGIKGQDIVEPDYEDLSTIIRIDEARIPWSIPREE